ncbi:MAG: glycosyltransferase family 2 protein [Clostridia bacterium]|nr:glycosyltransferase family 2 protein [Clostridia bacterium]
MLSISIIVPVYNAQNYLHKCLDSLLSQTFEDFELILVNDGSKDNSGQICDEYAARDSRVKVIHKENGGVSSARNAGLDHAQGKYIMFCDSDDYIYPDFCKPLYTLAEGDENCLVLAGITEIRDDGSKKDNLCPKYGEGESVNLSKQEFCDLYVELNLKAPFTLMNMPYNKLFSRKVIEDNHIRYNTKIHYNEDFIFNLDYLEKVDCVKIYNKSIYNYYLDAPGSLCKRYFDDIIEMFHAKEDRVKSVVLDNSTDREGAHRVWCTMVFGDTHRAINNTFSKANPASDKEKTRYCTALIRDERFKVALKGADTKGYNKMHVRLLHLGNYGLLRFLEK